MNQAVDPSSLAPEDLAYAMPGAFANLVTNGEWKYLRHLEYLEDILIEVEKGNIRRLIIDMPPQHGKSMFVSRFFTSWFLGRNPDKKVILASYESTFAAGWGAASRDALSEYGPPVFGVTLDENSQSKTDWKIAGHSGGMTTAGAGGPITGKGADLFIIDDPVKGQVEALSVSTQNSIWDWYVSVAYTRLSPTACIIIIMTRWAHNDLVGRLLKQEADGTGDKWHKAILPGLAKENDPLGREPGEALWPGRYNKDYLENVKSIQGTFWFEAMYQQNPRPRGGGLIKVEWFRRFKIAPLRTEVDQVIISVDTAQKAKELNDYTAIGVFLVRDNEYYLVHVLRDRMEHPRLIAVLKNLCKRWRPNAVLVEDKGSGISVIQHMREETHWGVIAIEPLTDKTIRMQSETPALEAGHVLLPEEGSQTWLYDFEEEIFAFPNSLNKDQVDMLSQALKYFRERLHSTADIW